MNRMAQKVVGAVVLALVLVACVKAQDELKPRETVVKATTATAGALDGEGLVKQLTGLGYEAKESKDVKGDVVGGSIRYEGKQFNYTVYVMLSPSKKFVWISLGFGTLPTLKAPPEVLKGLLALNDSSGPVFYSYDEKNNTFRLQSPLYNRGITPVLLKDMLRDFDVTVNAGSKFWNPKAWGSGLGAKEAGKPEGTKSDR